MSSSRPELRIDFATHAAAKFACENWHYSRAVPAGKTVIVGVWENGLFIGVVLFGLGSGNATRGERYGLNARHEVAELTRVALRDHVTQTSRIVSIACKFLRRRCPGIRLLISFADPEQQHHGGIYQAMGWMYSGCSAPDRKLTVRGIEMHVRSAGSRYGSTDVEKLRKLVDPNAKKRKTLGKHRYLLPLDDKMQNRIEPLRKPYPKRAKEQDAGPPALGGATPTRTLHQQSAV